MLLLLKKLCFNAFLYFNKVVSSQLSGPPADRGCGGDAGSSPSPPAAAALQREAERGGGASVLSGGGAWSPWASAQVSFHRRRFSRDTACLFSTIVQRFPLPTDGSIVFSSATGCVKSHTSKICYFYFLNIYSSLTSVQFTKYISVIRMLTCRWQSSWFMIHECHSLD